MILIGDLITQCDLQDSLNMPQSLDFSKYAMANVRSLRWNNGDS